MNWNKMASAKSSCREKVKSLTWKKWLQRDFKAFMISLFQDGLQKKYFKRIGFPNVRMKAMLYQRGFVYESQEVWDDLVAKLKQHLSTKSIFDVTDSLEKFHAQSVQRIKVFNASKEDPLSLLADFYEIISENVAYIWLAHGLEAYYNQRLHQEVPKYIPKEEVENFISEASFPQKKNAHALMEDAIRTGEAAEKIVQKYGWLKARGFGDPFTVEDIKKMKSDLHALEQRKKVAIPVELRSLFAEVQELVFFRTARTDVFYVLLFLAHPLFKKAAEKVGLSFGELPYYTIQSIIAGKPEKFTANIVVALYEKDYYVGEEIIVADETIIEKNQVMGKIAYPGKVQGIVRIVHSSTELEKVKTGDILVTQMTFPAFIPAMILAAAFVTDEGGITCHAAIVAREMKKPCVIGTRIATRVFKDGDTVEVDAGKGTVRKIQ